MDPDFEAGSLSGYVQDQIRYSSAIFSLIRDRNSGGSSPIVPATRVLMIVAILSSLITESVFRPVDANPGCEPVTGISAVFITAGIFEEMNATTTSYSFSSRTIAGRNFVAVKSVKGNKDEDDRALHLYAALMSLTL
jgi:hypothetical protein